MKNENTYNEIPGSYDSPRYDSSRVDWDDFTYLPNHRAVRHFSENIIFALITIILIGVAGYLVSLL